MACDARPLSAETDNDSAESPPHHVDPALLKQRRLLETKIDKVLDDWFVLGIHRAGAKKFIQDRIANPDDAECSRLRQWWLLQLNGRVWAHGLPLMCHASENVPGLRSHHIWPNESLPWLKTVEGHFEQIREELIAARSDGLSRLSGFQPYRDPVGSNREAAADGVGAEGVDRGAWNVLYLHLNHKRFDENCERFPATMRAIDEVFPRHYCHAFFSALTPGSHIMKHHGPSNRMLRTWLPICGMEGFRLRVGDTLVSPEEGKAFAWDHSFEHEAWHDGPEARIVLIVDVWHPDLTEPEVRFLRSLQNCRLRAGRALVEMSAGERTHEEATYFEIVDRARHLLSSDDWWVINAERDPTTKAT